ncbi:hypothetical protein KXZ28_06250, partial [Escherichia coli]|nr:hypothetical protein [Escherichia coli]
MIFIWIIEGEGRKACSLSYFACKAAEAELGLAYMA